MFGSGLFLYNMLGCWGRNVRVPSVSWGSSQTPGGVQVELLFSVFVALLFGPDWIAVVLCLDRLERSV